ncbi:hypothetical protein [Pseudomonas putida]|uniref:hypothetical protein n=1 Tax=Pseudomonas putida TaxID=303 RepID=UPI00080BD8B0|nr:hypothetical protein [Pseudomonas putida]
MKSITPPAETFSPKPVDFSKTSIDYQNRLIVSTVVIDGELVILSRFGDDTWHFNNTPTNIGKYSSSIQFGIYPEAYRGTIKEVAFCYLTRGRDSRRKAQESSAHRFVVSLNPFFKYLERLGTPDIQKLQHPIFRNFVHESRSLISDITKKPLGKSALVQRFVAVETLYELSQYTKTPLSEHPWPDSSAVFLANGTGANAPHKQQSLTPLIPDDIFCAIFEKAHDQVEKSDYLLNLRDEMEKINNLPISEGKQRTLKNKTLLKLGYPHKPFDLRKEITDLRTSCYIIIAGTSGCRNHELANLQNGSHHKTEGDDGEIYHWMRTVSEKTYTGPSDWMVPPIAVRAIRIMERWAEPYQKKIAIEIAARRKANPRDPEIALAAKHAKALFLATNKSGGVEGCRSLGNSGWNTRLQEFVESAGLNWEITTHQFRRKFANYAAHSKFGDLRYLKEHFKHWSMDMTLLYAMDDTWGQHFDLDLLFEVESEEQLIKEGVVSQWFDEKNLGGGYGRSLKGWQRDPLNLAIFKDHSTMIKSIAESTAIRSNGHSWCTADDTGCVGNTVERSRCGGCNNAVIGKEHAPMYQALYGNLQTLLDCKDIGEAGIIRVNRDLRRYADVLGDLGIDVETNLGQAT